MFVFFTAVGAVPLSRHLYTQRLALVDCFLPRSVPVLQGSYFFFKGIKGSVPEGFLSLRVQDHPEGGCPPAPKTILRIEVFSLRPASGGNWTRYDSMILHLKSASSQFFDMALGFASNSLPS